MTHTIKAADLRKGDHYMSTANAGRSVKVTDEPRAVDDDRIILKVTDSHGMTYTTILKASRELEAAETRPTADGVRFNGREWESEDGSPVCQDHATPLPCPFCEA